jgi:Cu(I)/Ag(I) efflux system membrane protein CusA/SilA
VSLPLGILMAFIVMHWQGINANIMSLGGIAIAVGAMVDAAVVMIENAHKHIERWHEKNPGIKLTGEYHWKVIGESAVEVGPALFFSLLIITLSFIPIFTLEAQEGRLFFSSRIHQNLCDGSCCRACGDIDTGINGLPYPRQSAQ